MTISTAAVTGTTRQRRIKGHDKLASNALGKVEPHEILEVSIKLRALAVTRQVANRELDPGR